MATFTISVNSRHIVRVSDLLGFRREREIVNSKIRNDQNEILLLLLLKSGLRTADVRKLSI